MMTVLLDDDDCFMLFDNDYAYDDDAGDDDDDADADDDYDGFQLFFVHDDYEQY